MGSEEEVNNRSMSNLFLVALYIFFPKARPTVGCSVSSI